VAQFSKEVYGLAGDYDDNDKALIVLSLLRKQCILCEVQPIILYYFGEFLTSSNSLTEYEVSYQT
jgi:hypothetical protein